MTGTGEERDWRERFATLRREEESRVSALRAMLDASSAPPPFSSFVPVLVGVALVAVLGLLVHRPHLIAGRQSR